MIELLYPPPHRLEWNADLIEVWLHEVGTEEEEPQFQESVLPSAGDPQPYPAKEGPRHG
jgi:hypothetical protein